MKIKLMAVLSSLVILAGCSTSPSTDLDGSPSPSPNASPSPTQSQPAEEFTNPGFSSDRELQRRSLSSYNALNETLKTTISYYEENGYYVETLDREEDTITYLVKLGKTPEAATVVDYKDDGSRSIAPIFPEMLAAFSNGGSYFRLDLLSFELSAIKDILYADALPVDNIPGAASYESFQTSTGFEYISPITSYKVNVVLKDGVVASITESDTEKIVYSYEFNYSEKAEYADILKSAVLIP